MACHTGVEVEIDKKSTFVAVDFLSPARGDWKRGTGHRETIEIVRADIARLDNAAPYQT